MIEAHSRPNPSCTALCRTYESGQLLTAKQCKNSLFSFFGLISFKLVLRTLVVVSFSVGVWVDKGSMLGGVKGFIGLVIDLHT
jgi:hypothetical protein